MELIADAIHAIGGAYALRVQGAARRVGERVWCLRKVWRAPFALRGGCGKCVCSPYPRGMLTATIG